MDTRKIKKDWQKRHSSVCKTMRPAIVFNILCPIFFCYSPLISCYILFTQQMLLLPTVATLAVKDYLKAQFKCITHFYVVHIWGLYGSCSLKSVTSNLPVKKNPCLVKVSLFTIARSMQDLLKLSKYEMLMFTTLKSEYEYSSEFML